jgi:hypothetical protein
MRQSHGMRSLGGSCVRMLVVQLVVTALYQRGSFRRALSERIYSKKRSRALRRNGRVIKIDILLAVVCAQADHVALVCHDVDELELAIEPADSRVGLSKLLAYLDGKAKRWCVSELEADYGMRDPGRTPIIDRDVDADDLRDTHRARLPNARYSRFRCGSRSCARYETLLGHL